MRRMSMLLAAVVAMLLLAGGGNDRVYADETDYVASDCEKVLRLTGVVLPEPRAS